MKTFTLLVAAAAIALAAMPVNAAVVLSRTPNANPGAPSHDDCRAELGHFRIVRPAQIVAIGPDNSVFVQPVCEGREAGAIKADGNAGGLLKTIARNERLTSALDDKDYETDDVIGVRFGARGSVILYVHRYR